LLGSDDFESVSKVLRGASITNLDFEKVINKARNGDFVFADPPYTVKHENNGFVKYNEKLFSWGDQIRLKNALVRASERGAFIMLTNAYHKSIERLYVGTGFKKKGIYRSSVIAASNEDRGKYREYIIKNF